MIRQGKATASDGADLTVQADTVCIHADTLNAVAFAREIRRRLTDDGVVIRPPRG